MLDTPNFKYAPRVPLRCSDHEVPVEQAEVSDVTGTGGARWRRAHARRLAPHLPRSLPTMVGAGPHGVHCLHGPGQLRYRPGGRCGVRIFAPLGGMARLRDGDATTVPFG